MFDLTPLRLPDSATVIDCGANEGQFLDCLYRHVKTPRVIAIEMLPDLAARCAERHPAAVILNCALGAESGTAQYYRYQFSPMSSLLPLAQVAQRHYRQQECTLAEECQSTKVETLDALLAPLGVSSVQLLKLDLQGGELPALLGACNTLAMTENVIAEVELIELYERQALAGEVDEFLQSCGFQIRADLFSHVGQTSNERVAVDRWYSR